MRDGRDEEGNDDGRKEGRKEEKEARTTWYEGRKG
jgi:hypothetical protein